MHCIVTSWHNIFKILNSLSYFCNVCFSHIGKAHLVTCYGSTEKKQQYNFSLPLTVALYWVGWLMPCPGHFTPKNDPVPIVHVAGWALKLVWISAENLASMGIRSLEHPTGSESLHWLRILFTHNVFWTFFPFLCLSVC